MITLYIMPKNSIRHTNTHIKCLKLFFKYLHHHFQRLLKKVRQKFFARDKQQITRNFKRHFQQKNK